jgi:pyridine nucleotide-disulfide oxidoreductase family protein
MKHLVLIGGGHAHVQVLAALAASPMPGVSVTLVSPYARQIYSGMLPGWIAGHYAIDQCAIRIDLLARRAGVGFVLASAVALNLAARTVLCSNGETCAFDLISIDCGPSVDLSNIPGATEHAIPIRPIEQFVAAWPALLEQARQSTDGFRVAIAGDGAAGTELAFALQARFASENLHQASVSLIGSHDAPLAGFPGALRRKALTLLSREGIHCIPQCRVLAALPGALSLSDGRRFAADASLIVTGAAAPAWPADSGLATDAGGFIQVSRTLQSRSHPFVFAAGDIAAYADPRPKSGVFAVRAGPPLAGNLRAALAGQALQPWVPQPHALYLISTGKRYALASRASLTASGHWVWRWKDWIDRRFMRRFEVRQA